jgi:mercuric ion transport protein
MLASVIQKFNLLKVGLVGSIVTAICYFTPFLEIVFDMTGLSPTAGYLDVILLPLLAVFIGVTIYAPWRQSKAS